jgi:hypothetical protein
MVGGEAMKKDLMCWLCGYGFTGEVKNPEALIDLCPKCKQYIEENEEKERQLNEEKKRQLTVPVKIVHTCKNVDCDSGPGGYWILRNESNLEEAIWYIENKHRNNDAYCPDCQEELVTEVWERETDRFLWRNE